MDSGDDIENSFVNNVDLLSTKELLRGKKDFFFYLFEIQA